MWSIRLTYGHILRLLFIINQNTKISNLYKHLFRFHLNNNKVMLKKLQKLMRIFYRTFLHSNVTPHDDTEVLRWYPPRWTEATPSGPWTFQFYRRPHCECKWSPRPPRSPRRCFYVHMKSEPFLKNIKFARWHGLKFNFQIFSPCSSCYHSRVGSLFRPSKAHHNRSQDRRSNRDFDNSIVKKSLKQYMHGQLMINHENIKRRISQEM